MSDEDKDSESDSDSDDTSEKKKKKNKNIKKEKEAKKGKKENKESEKPKEVLGYIEDFNFDIKITKASENSLKISLVSKEGTDNFESEYTLKDLINENKVFLIFENIDEVIDNLKLVIENEYLSLFLDMNYDFYFEFFIDINGNKKQIRLLIEPLNEDSKKKMALRIQEQNKKIEKLEKKNKKLEENYQNLYDSVKKNYIVQNQFNNIVYKANTQKNLSIDSKIFKTEEEIDFIKTIIYDRKYKNSEEKNKNSFSLNLIYRGTRDGDMGQNFHKLCDGLSPILLIIKTTHNVRFGGYTETYFEGTNEYLGKKDDNAFIYNLDKRKYYNIKKGQNAILCYKNYGPVFYGNEFSNIFLKEPFFKKKGSVAPKGDRFETKEDFEINLGKQYFKPLQIEVFHIKLNFNDD